MRKFYMLMVAAIAVSGCAKSQSTQTSAEAAAPQATDNTSAVCRAAASTTATPELWSAANNAFGFDMLKATQPDASVVLSPYSVQRAMGMLLDGACGDTAAEIQKALHLPDADNNSEIGQQIEKSVLAVLAPDMHTIDIDNHLWIQKSYEIKADYLDRVKQYYAATPESVDFVNEPDASRQYINDFIAKATHDKILNIIPASAVTPLTRLILTNAVYFKGPWRNNFDEGMTNKADFVTANGTIQVDMMHHTAQHLVYENESYTVFDMDFMGADYAMMIAMPKYADGADVAQTLAEFETQFNSVAFRQARSQLESERIALSMPKFRVEFNTSLKGLLRDLGVQHAFSDPDFSAITGNRELYLSDVLHKAYIDVNENGAEAAAATAVVMKLRSALPMNEPKIITVDHPFLFAIVEKSTQTALFIGRVTKI